MLVQAQATPDTAMCQPRQPVLDRNSILRHPLLGHWEQTKVPGSSSSLVQRRAGLDSWHAVSTPRSV